MKETKRVFIQARVDPNQANRVQHFGQILGLSNADVLRQLIDNADIEEVKTLRATVRVKAKDGDQVAEPSAVFA